MISAGCQSPTCAKGIPGPEVLWGPTCSLFEWTRVIMEVSGPVYRKDGRPMRFKPARLWIEAPGVSVILERFHTSAARSADKDLQL